MASFVLDPRADVPEGTTVDVYPLSQFPKGNMNKTPFGSPAASAVMEPDGAVFYGLEQIVQYAATFVDETSGERISIKIYIPRPISLVTNEDLDAALAEFGERVTTELSDDFTQAELGNFTSRVADSGQTYEVTGDTLPKIERVNGINVLSIANAVAAGIHSFYLEAPLSGDCRYAFAQVMYGATDATHTTDDSAIALASPATTIAEAGGTFDIGAHCVLSASGGVEGSTWVDLTPITTSDLDGSNLYGSAAAPDPDTPVWIGWILCENGTLLLLAPDGEIITARDTRYVINSGPFAWLEPYLTAGNTDVRPYALKWHAGCSVNEAQAALAHEDDLAEILFSAGTVQESLGSLTRGDKVNDAATGANTNETDLHSFDVSGGTLGADKEKIVAKFAGTTGATATTKRIRAYFGGTLVFDSTALTLNDASWEVDLTIIRLSATTFRVIARGALSTNSVVKHTSVADVAAASAQVLKVTGTNGTGNANDIVARFSTWGKAHAA